jgi:PKD repeat protein
MGGIHRAPIVGLVVAALALFAAPASQALDGPPAQVGQWGPVLDWGVQGKHMVLLNTGKVLVWSAGDQARVWDPTTGTFELTPAPFGDVHCASQVTLADGRVLVAGGQNGVIHDGLSVTSIFDPLTQTWRRGADMAYARWYPTLTTLPDGRALVTSGDATTGTRIDVPEIYDPATDKWTPTAPRSQGLYPFMYVLPSGLIYEAGTGTATAYFNPAGGGSWSPGPAASFGSSAYSESGAMYEPGKILRAGGGDPAMNRTQVIDMNAANPQWEETAPMAFPRRRMNTPILADGSIMAVGGTRQADDDTQAVLDGEIWSPATKQWTTVASMSEARMYHSTALLLPDGRVVTAGGESGGRLRAEIYSPPYLFKGQRPTITASPDQAGYGATFSIATDVSDIAKVAIIRPSGVTHAIDMNERYVPLGFTASGNQLTVDAPPSANHAPPGYYMIVVVDSKGVPSVARWIHLGAATPPPPPPSGAPRAGFTASPLSGPPPLTVSFKDASSPAPTKWAWDFDHDGHVDSTARNPQFAYSTPGVYGVSLTVSNASGTSTLFKPLYVAVGTAPPPAEPPDPPPSDPPPSQPPPPPPQASAPPGSPEPGQQPSAAPVARPASGVRPRPGCKVPRLRGKTRRAARAGLVDARCATARPAHNEYSTRVRRGRVTRTVPSAGTWTSRQVVVVLSMGRRKHRAARPRAVRTASVGVLCPLLGRAAAFAPGVVVSGSRARAESAARSA